MKNFEDYDEKYEQERLEEVNYGLFPITDAELKLYIKVIPLLDQPMINSETFKEYFNNDEQLLQYSKGEKILGFQKKILYEAIPSTANQGKQALQRLHALNITDDPIRNKINIHNLSDMLSSYTRANIKAILKTSKGLLDETSGDFGVYRDKQALKQLKDNNILNYHNEIRNINPKIIRDSIHFLYDTTKPMIQEILKKVGAYLIYHQN